MIGTKARWMTGALVSAGLLLGSIGPAEARPRYGYDRGSHGGWDRHHRHRDNGFGVGDAIGVAALVGAVAIVASSMSKDKKAQAARPADDNDAPPPGNGTDYGADIADRDIADRDIGYRDGADRAPPRDDDFSDIAAGSDDAMTDSCALAARDQAQGNSGYAEIRHMDAPRPGQNGGYNIDGEVESRASYRAGGGETRRFTCAMNADGQVAQVYLSRHMVSR